MEIQNNTTLTANSDCSNNKTNVSTTANLKQSVQEGNNFQSFDKLSINTDDLTRLIWGDSLRDEVFDRWSQGFIFSSQEQTALIQLNGGPCAVLCAVQAYLLNDLLFCTKCKNDWQNPSAAELTQHLTNALLAIYSNVCADTHDAYIVVYENEVLRQADVDANDENELSSSADNLNCRPQAAKKLKLDHAGFLDKLKVLKCNTSVELKESIFKNIDRFMRDYGVLSFLYSIIITKGIEKLKIELDESADQLIDSVHGHGSQNLINLLLCGIATSHIFDDDKCLEGLTLQGIPKQSKIGFLTIMEYLRYCEVGWYLKNPKSPIWILGSETHLTVFFSQEKSLIQEDNSSRRNALKSFSKYDPDENGFVKTEDLLGLMQSLDLVTEKEYIDIVRQQLDSENLGIITQTAFLNEFYPQEETNSIPETFRVYHYNAVPRSNVNNLVEYSIGEARLIDFTDQPELDINSIKSCLQTKWPTIEIKWSNNIIPSLN